MDETSTLRHMLTSARRFTLACFFSALVAPSAHARGEITILTDTALVAPLTEISRLYARENDAIISVVVGNAGTASERIRGGLPVDLVLTAGNTIREALMLSGQIDQSASTLFTKDPVALVTSRTPKRLGTGDHSITNMLLGVQNPTLVLIDAEGDPSLTQASEYATSHVFDPKPKIVITPDMKTALYELQTQGSFALVPYSLALKTPKLNVQSVITQGKDVKSTEYYAEVLASEHMTTARNFTRFLMTDNVQSILSRHGFLKP